MLEIRDLNAFYGAVQVLHGINLTLAAGEIVGLVGANAAGKSTLMFTLAGLRTTCTGQILFNERSIANLAAYDRVPLGLVLVPERRRLFPFMTVFENLELVPTLPVHALRLTKRSTKSLLFFQCWRSAACRPRALSVVANSKCWPSAER